MSPRGCIHHLVQEKAIATPQSTALICGKQKLSYGELEALANQVSNLLHSSGITLESPVAICMQRSIEFVVSALGVLKAGCAYAPLDPGYPGNRISMLLQDAGASIVLMQQCVTLPAGPWKTIVLNPEGLDTAQYSMVPAVTNVSPDNLAYIIFTSGSTGRPKGVQVTHANLMNLVSWHRRAFSVTANDRAMLYSSPGFDASVWELWPYLASGASVSVVDENVRTLPEALRDWIIANGITIGFLPTAVAESMIALPWPRTTSFRVLLTGADTLRRRPSKDLPFLFVNNYGPTECTVVASSGTVPSEIGLDKLPSIGRPIDNVTVHVVDDKLQPVADGDPGELLIGGAGVARGYLNAPELTAERFVPDCFSKVSGQRLYRTGDLGRFLPDGQIEFLGRMDEQVKIMGYRIEPREISAVLDLHPGIAESAVVARQGDSGTQRLLAYIVPATPVRLSSGELCNFLAAHLPDYMVPSVFVTVAELPRSAHGKVDRAALPEPTSANILSDVPFDAPQSAVERHLAAFLSSLVRVDRVGRDDNFFTLGGHSLMGAQLIAKVRETFGVELSLRTLFEAPTVRQMSEEIEKLIFEKISAMSEDEATRALASSADGA